MAAMVAAFLVRTALSPAQVRYWVEEALQKAELPVQVEFSEVRLEFSRGIFPWFGLVAENVSVIGQRSCESLSEFTVDRVAVPLSLTHLFRREIYVSHLYLGQAQFRYMPAACEPAPAEENSAAGATLGTPATPPAASGVQPVRAKQSETKKFVFEPERLKKMAEKYNKGWSQLNTQVARNLGEILIERLDIVDGRRPGLNLQLSALKWSPATVNDRREWHLKTRMKLAGDWLDSQSSSSFEVQITFAEQTTQLNLEGNYKEGKINWVADYDWSNHRVQLDLQQDQVPLNPIIRMLKDQRIITNDLQPKFVWLSCRVKYDGLVSALSSQPLQLEPCSIQGDLGELVMKSWRWFPWREPIFDPFVVELKELDLHKLVQIVNRTGLSGILSRFGLLSGNLHIENPNHMVFKGELRNIEMAFSNRGERGKQLVPRLVGELTLNEDRVLGNFPEVELEQGEFKGQITFNLDREFRSGVLQLAIDRLGFHPSIQKLMVGGTISPISIYGQGKVENGEISSWRGEFGIREMRNERWTLEEVKLTTDLAGGKFVSNTKAKRVELPAASEYYRLARPMFLDEKGLDTSLIFDRFSGKLQIGRGEGRWDKLSASVLNRVVVSSSGKWSTDQKVEGAMFVDFPVLKLLRWDITGSWDRIQLQPSAKMLKDLARRHPEIRPPDTLEFVRSGEILVQEISTQGVEKLKAIGQKVIETARKIIPESEKGGELNTANPEDTPAAPPTQESNPPVLEQ